MRPVVLWMWGGETKGGLQEEATVSANALRQELDLCEKQQGQWALIRDRSRRGGGQWRSYHRALKATGKPLNFILNIIKINKAISFEYKNSMI